jgi:hypothetical protein
MEYLMNDPEHLSTQSYLLHFFCFPDEGSGNVCTNNGQLDITVKVYHHFSAKCTTCIELL